MNAAGRPKIDPKVMTMLDGLPRQGSVVIAPVLHYKLEYADAVRRLIAAWRPEAIVVELPPTLEPHARRAVARLPQLTVVLYESAAGEPVYLPVEPCDALIEAVRSGLELGIPVIFGDADIDAFPLYDEPFPDSYAVHRLGLAAVWQAYRAACPEPASDPENDRRETSLAWHAQQAAEDGRRVLLVCGAAHALRVERKLAEPLAQPLARQRRQSVQSFNVHPDSARGIMATLPFVASVYELRRRELPDLPPRLEPKLTQHASGFRLVSTGLESEALQSARRDRLRRELARTCGAAPDDYLSPLDPLVVQEGLRGASAEAYAEHTGETLQPSESRTWRIFCRNWAIVEGRLLPDLYQLVVGARGVADDNLAHEVWDLGSEWPWQQEAAELPTARMSPDEIWLGSKRIVFRPRVKREKIRLHPVRLKVGSVVVIFDEDEADHRYPWRMTWHGEHIQESDMAFYATPADRQIVGPGIARCEYGGFLMSYPPGRMYEIWSDPDYDWVRSKSERLLLAGLDYSEHRHVVYVAAKPPRSTFKTWAGRIGRQIIYLPIGSLSPVTLKKLRVFHVLSGHDKREIAKEYLW